MLCCIVLYHFSLLFIVAQILNTAVNMYMNKLLHKMQNRILSASMTLPNSNMWHMNTLKVEEQLTWNQEACDFFFVYTKSTIIVFLNDVWLHIWIEKCTFFLSILAVWSDCCEIERICHLGQLGTAMYCMMHCPNCVSCASTVYYHSLMLTTAC